TGTARGQSARDSSSRGRNSALAKRHCAHHGNYRSCHWELVRGGALDVRIRRRGSIRRGLSTLAVLGVAGAIDVLDDSSAGASSRGAMVATTSTGSGGVLLALGGAVLVLGII